MMLSQIIGRNQDVYGIYYIVFGCVNADGQLVTYYLWAGPYNTLAMAFNKAEELKDFYHDDSFVVRKYTQHSYHLSL